MFVKFNFKATVGIGTVGGVHPIIESIPFCIEQEDAQNAMNLMTVLSNNDKVTDAMVTVKKPMDANRVYIGMDGCTQSRSDHMVKSQDTQSFIWALKAGMVMQRGLKK